MEAGAAEKRILSCFGTVYMTTAGEKSSRSGEKI